MSEQSIEINALSKDVNLFNVFSFFIEEIADEKCDLSEKEKRFVTKLKGVVEKGDIAFSDLSQCENIFSDICFTVSGADCLDLWEQFKILLRDVSYFHIALFHDSRVGYSNIYAFHINGEVESDLEEEFISEILKLDNTFDIMQFCRGEVNSLRFGRYTSVVPVEIKNSILPSETLCIYTKITSLKTSFLQNLEKMCGYANWDVRFFDEKSDQSFELKKKSYESVRCIGVKKDNKKGLSVNDLDSSEIINLKRNSEVLDDEIAYIDFEIENSGAFSNNKSIEEHIKVVQKNSSVIYIGPYTKNDLSKELSGFISLILLMRYGALLEDDMRTIVFPV